MCLGSLQIEDCMESDEGKYECVAENSVGVAYSYPANLYVRGRFQRFTFLSSSSWCRPSGGSTLGPGGTGPPNLAQPPSIFGHNSSATG